MIRSVPVARPRPPGARAALLAAALALAPAVTAQAQEADVPLELLANPALSEGRASLGPGGLGVDVDRRAFLIVPATRVAELYVELVTDSLFLLTWCSHEGGPLTPSTPPWRYRTLSPGRHALRLDVLQTPDWAPDKAPVLVFSGTGHVTITRAHVRLAPADPDAAAAARDAARRWAPEAIGYTTINFLEPPYWSVSRDVPLTWVLAGVAAVAGLATLAAARLRRRRWRADLAIAAAALVATALFDARFLATFLPSANLSVHLDREARIRDGYAFAPHVGALAAVARATLGPAERVGVMADAEDWFGAQTLCFDLLPRRCAVVRPGEAEHAGLSGVDHLRTQDLDAIVALDPAEPLPDGFAPVAALSRNAFVARRR